MMTVDDFSRLPEDSGPVYHELRGGVVFAVSRPKAGHTKTAKRLERLVEAAAGSPVYVVFAFRPLPEHELRVADVAWLSPEREAAIDPENYLRGVPELVIEILSPGNSAVELYAKEQLCLENGALEFWVVDSDRKQVKVSTPDGRTVTYRAGQEMPVRLFGGARLPVDDVFA